MKKIMLMIVAVFGLALAANAQSDQCKLEGGNGGHIKAFVSSTNSMGNGTSPQITITTQPSVEQPADGSVICKITYERKSDGQKESITRDLNFFKKASKSNQIQLDSPAKRIVSIEIWGAECKSASRPW